MSEADVQIVRSVFEAISRGGLDSALEHLTPDAVIDMSRALGVNRGVYTRDEFRAVSEEFASAWESERYEIGEIIEAGDRLVVPWTNNLRGRDGIELQARGVWVGTVRDGAIVHVCLYQEREEALAAVGLA